MKIWTEAYRPFMMGGDVNAPIRADVPVEGPHRVGDMELYVATAPNGKTFVAEGTTGAIVGGTLDQVYADLESAEQQIIVGQLERAAVRVQKATTISPEEFWRMLGVLK